mmetsp:Transcript_3475/g.7046  ORF Transcript_3475/g.7046 Transcript_3475/m.7046 type:complete len:203 (+) Transcript_3475:232-840(+)
MACNKLVLALETATENGTGASYAHASPLARVTSKIPELDGIVRAPSRDEVGVKRREPSAVDSLCVTLQTPYGGNLCPSNSYNVPHETHGLLARPDRQEPPMVLVVEHYIPYRSSVPLEDEVIPFKGIADDRQVVVLLQEHLDNLDRLVIASGCNQLALAIPTRAINGTKVMVGALMYDVDFSSLFVVTAKSKRLAVRPDCKH